MRDKLTKTNPKPFRIGLCFVLFMSALAFAQPGPPEDVPAPGPLWLREDAAFNPARVVAAGQYYLDILEPMALFEHVHGRRGEKREVKVLLGDGEVVFARLNLDPVTREPVPLGLEELAPPVPRGARAEALFESLGAWLPNLTLSAVVVPEKEGYKLFLVYQGRMVGELKLSPELTPLAEKKWLDEYEKSSWRYP